MEQQDQASKIVKQDVDENTQHSDNIQKHDIISGMVINPIDAAGSPDATHESIPRSVDRSLRAGEDEDPKVKDNQPRRASASPQRRTTRTSLGHDHSAGQSPLHHHQQARVANKGGSFSPSWEGKVSSASHTPGRSRLRAGGRADESPEEGSAVPKFGEWDEDNPSSADGFTGIFNKVREEKLTSATKVPMFTDDSAYLNNYHHKNASKVSHAGGGRQLATAAAGWRVAAAAAAGGDCRRSAAASAGGRSEASMLKSAVKGFSFACK